MLSIKKYISNQILNENVIINNELELHFYAEFVLQESFKYSYFKIFESNGSYIGQKELIIDLSKEIYKSIKDKEYVYNFKLNKNDLEEYDNIFFKELEINLVKKGDTAYIVNKSKYIKEENLFDLVIINLNINDNKEYKNIVRSIMHEMLHAYNHWQSFNKNSKTNILSLADTKSKYYKIFYNNNKRGSSICNRIIHDLRKFEQNAYFAELSSELDLSDFDFSKYKDTNEAYKKAVEIFKKSDVLQQYIITYNYIKKIKEKFPEDIDDFVKQYNNVNNTNYKIDKIIKILKGKYDKIFKRIESLVPKIFYNYYQKSLEKTLKESLLRPNNSLIEFMKFESEKYNYKWIK